MPYNPNKHGRAEYGSYMQLPEDVISGMVEGDESKPLLQQRFARLVYTVNPSDINISGAQISIDKVGLKASDEVGVTSGALNVYDQGVINAINNKNITIDEVSLSGVSLSGDQLKVFDQDLVDEVNQLRQENLQLHDLLIDKNYSRIIQDRGDDVYFAHAPIGTSTSTSGWRVYKLDKDGSRSWASSGSFVNPANIELSGLTYNY